MKKNLMQARLMHLLTDGPMDVSPAYSLAARSYIEDGWKPAGDVQIVRGDSFWHVYQPWTKEPLARPTKPAKAAKAAKAPAPAQ